MITWSVSPGVRAATAVVTKLREQAVAVIGANSTKTAGHQDAFTPPEKGLLLFMFILLRLFN
jgi:hypothetical protein